MKTPAGSITPVGYTAPNGAPITWRRGWQSGEPDAVTHLNTSVKWTRGDDESFVRKYADDRHDLGGHVMVPMQDHFMGGEAYAILLALFEAAGVGRVPTEEETVDFAVANFPNGPATLADYEEWIGKPDPGSVDPRPPKPTPPPSPIGAVVARLGALEQFVAGLHEARNNQREKLRAHTLRIQSIEARLDAIED